MRATDRAYPTSSASLILSITVIPALPVSILTTMLPDGMSGLAYSARIALSSGTPPFKFRIVSGALPPGLTLSASTGAITGKPQAAGQWYFSVGVVDSAVPATSATRALGLRVRLLY